eukprot:s194_g36.t1
MDLHFVWQAWHLVTFTLCGRRGTYGIQLALVTRLFPLARRLFCVAGVAFGDIDLHFVRLFCVAGVAFGDMDRCVAGVALGQAWHLWHLAGSCDALGSRWRRNSFAWQAWHLETWTFTLCGRRGTWRHGLSLCVASVALMALNSSCDALGSRWRRGSFAWQAWHLETDLHFVSQAWHLATWTFTLCGRRGTYGTQLALVTRLVPVGAWHLATWTFTLCGRRGTYGTQLALVTRLVPVWRLATLTFTLCGKRGTYGTQLALVTRLVPVGAAALLRSRHGTWRHGPSLCVAGVALGDMGLHFVWQAWHLAAWTFTLCGKRGTYGIQLALVTRLVPVGAAALLRSRCGTWRHGPSLCVAGAALGDMGLHFVWQAWHSRPSAGSCDALGSRWRRSSFAWQAWHLETSTFTLCGKRGTWRHAPSLCVAGVALMALSWLL